MSKAVPLKELVDGHSNINRIIILYAKERTGYILDIKIDI